MIAPCLFQGDTTTSVYFPEDARWYEISTWILTDEINEVVNTGNYVDIGN